MNCVLRKVTVTDFGKEKPLCNLAAWLTQATLGAVRLLGQGLMPKGTAWPGIECDKQEGFSPAWTLVKGFLRQDDTIKSPRVQAALFLAGSLPC